MTSAVVGRHRVMAVIALILAAVLVVVVVGLLASVLWALVLSLVGLLALGQGVWWLITEHGRRARLGLLLTILGLVAAGGALVLGVNEAQRPLLGLLLVAALGLGTAWSARAAVVASVRELDLARSLPVFRPRHPVLICNPRSGGGKVERFGLVDKARELGVEVVLLEPGLDLEALARDAVARGADCLGMAGGDGSQALVASIAVAHDLPFVCISAGTRNHFALDLGLDRDDPSRGLVAFSDGVLRSIDYATVSGRLFVNNVSLGVYAQIVEQDSYRDAKLATTREELPNLVGSQADEFDLQFTTPAGDEVDGALVILVSNNPYVLGPRLDLAQRRSLTTGRLGVVAINAASGEAGAAILRSALVRDATEGIVTFTAGSFQVRSRGGRVSAGVDGESLELSTPLEFRTHPRGLRVLVPADNPAAVAARHYRGLGLRGLWDIARGRTPAQLLDLA